ncbi:MAG: CBS domain-containing protein [Desulfurobacteriaceae bacterium]
MKTIITTHKNMDLDALGGVIAAKKLFQDATVVLPDTKGNDVVKLLSENPDVIEFVEESNFSEEDVDKIVIVDTNNIDRIPDKLSKLVKSGKVEVEIFDHHSKTIEVEDVIFHFKGSGSITSLMALILKGKNLSPSPLEASVMLTGIYSDTGSFRFPSTTPLDFLAAAYLLSLGANIEFVKKYLPTELSDKELDLLKTLKDNLKVLEINGNPIGISFARFDAYVGDIAPLVSKLLEISGLPAVIVLAEFENTVFLIGRSRTSKIDVSKIASAFGGGGHKEAASSSIKEKTVFEVLEELYRVLEETVEPLKRAKDIMTSPAIVIPKDFSVADARNLLMKNGINAAPVVDEEGKLVGVVNRALLDKADYMGLSKEKVSEVMERDFSVVSMDTPLSEVERIIVEKHQSFIPVIEDRKPVGVITRTDLLMNLYRDDFSESLKFYEKRLSSFPKFRNLSQKLKSLPKEIFNLLKKIGELADELGVNAYVVGGFVRDLIIGRKNFDIDIVVEGDARVLAREVARRLKAKVHTFDRFKTAVVIFPDGFRIDFASARTEVYKFPGALPEVDMAPLRKDLFRRDFTINTLAIKLNKSEFGKLIDFFNGLKDIKEGKIRILHSLSFVEDPTRILRALRFATRYRFELGKHTEKLLKIAVKKKLFKTVEGRRIYHELKQIFLEDNPLRVLNKLEHYGILKTLFPKVSWDKKKKDLFERIRKIVIWHKMTFPEKEVKYYLLYFAALFAGLFYNVIENYLSELSVPEKEKRTIKELALKSFRVLKKLEKIEKNSEIYRILSTLPEEFSLFLAGLEEDDKIREKILLFLKEWRFKKPLVNGEDLKKLGLSPGPLFKEILDKIVLKVLDGELPEDREEQLEFVKKECLKQLS